jgi:hypothetical protein
MLLQASDEAGSQLEELFKIPFAMNHSEDKYVFAFDAIDNDIFADGKAARSGTEILVTGAACVRKFGQKTESISDGVHQVCGDIHAAAFSGDIEPDVVQIGFGSWSDKVCHQLA